MKDDKQTQSKPFKVGNKIIDFGQVYRIFKIEKRKSAEDKKEKVIHFKPYYKTKQNKDLVCSIPVKNIGLTHIRKPISKNRMKQLLKKLSEKENKKRPINTTPSKEKLRLNKLSTTAQILKRLWLDKQDESTNFTGNKQNLLNLSMKRLVEEAAFVSNISLAKAGKKIKESLRKLKNDEQNET